MVTDVATGSVTPLPAGQEIMISGSVPGLVASILPLSRSVQVGTTATVFATILAVGSGQALVCEPSLAAGVPVTFDFQTTDSSNLPTGTRATPVSIASGAGQSFVLAFTPTAPFGPVDLEVRFACGQTTVPPLVGINTLLLSGTPSRGPDIVALAATLTNDGIVNIPGVTGTGAFAVATVNVGAGAPITATVDTGSVILPVVLSLCQTNSAGACINPATPGPSATVQIGDNQTPTFAIFVQGTGTVVFFSPGVNRVFVRFKDAANVTRGATSVAVRTQ